MNPVQPLLRESIDYAGLFPPAALDMPSAVSNYAVYATGQDRWALGRFILPVSRLPEFVQAGKQLSNGGSAWRLSALPEKDLVDQLAAVSRFNDRGDGRAIIDTIEVKAGSSAAIRGAMHAIPDDIQAYF